MQATHRVVSWSPAYALGLDEVDHQHQALLGLINRLWNCVVDHAGVHEVLRVLADLESYTLAHFVAEETFMRLMDYPMLPEHQQAHRAFVERVAAERARVEQGGRATLELVHFLKDWLINHILVADKSYAAFTQLQRAARRHPPTPLGRLFSRWSLTRA